MRERAAGRPGRVEVTLPPAASEPHPGSGSHGRLSVQFLGTATTLVRAAGFTVLTDPNFLRRGQRAWLGHGLTSKRLTAPALKVDELPPLDLVVLSHLHGDHFDRVARRGLDRDLPLVTTRQAARRLRPQGFRHALALDTWQQQVFRRGTATLTVTSMPGRHAPGPAQALLPPVMGSLLQVQDGDGPVTTLYVTGDTLLVDELAEIGRRYPSIDLSLLHLGGTRILGLLVTMDARQGADLLELLRPAAAVPVHYDDYAVFRSPLSDFRAEVERRSLPVEVTYLARGQTHVLAD